MIQDNASFFAQISPVLQAEQSIGYDLIVISDGWELTQLIKNRWLIPLDHSRMPNFCAYAGPSRPQSALRPAQPLHGHLAVGDDRDRLRPAPHRARDHQRQGPLGPGVQGQGRDDGRRHRDRRGRDAGARHRPGDVDARPTGAAPRSCCTKQRDDGIVRQYYDQSYIKALEDGDTWISQAWSGDVFVANYSGFKNLKFVVPEEGAMLWHDNCMIPLHAAHPVDAMEWIDFYYRPPIQGLIEDWVNYICPVPAAQGR